MQSLETSSVDESFNFWNHLRRTAMFAKKNNDPNNTVTVIGQRLGPEFIQTLEENLIPLNTPERRAKPMQTVVAPSKTTTASVLPASKVAGSGPQAISEEEESEKRQGLRAEEKRKGERPMEVALQTKQKSWRSRDLAPLPERTTGRRERRDPEM